MPSLKPSAPTSPAQSTTTTRRSSSYAPPEPKEPRIDPQFDNAIWSALTTLQARFALGSGPALRYPADVIPFAAVVDHTPPSLTALRQLLDTDELIYLSGGPLPDVAPLGLTHVRELPLLRMHHPGKDLPARSQENIRPLSREDLGDMIALTDVAFPGFFLPRAPELGRFFGIHVAGDLIAMAGERIALANSHEISAVCTHPAHRGKGYAAQLVTHLLHVHAEAGEHSFLHVLGTNRDAISVYERLGFTLKASLLIHQLRRVG